MAQNYVLQVTTGTEYDISTHKVVPVNTPQTIKLESEDVSVELSVRVQNYRGLPKSSPTTSPYFSLPPHDYNKDQYSIAFTFTPKRTIPGKDLVFGNDFDHPIRDRLPPGFNTAFKIVKWAVDPGLEGDVYAEKPYLYGGVGGSVNTLYIKEGEGEEKTGDEGEEDEEEHEDVGLVFKEGGDEEGLETREDNGVPATEAGRKKWFLNQTNRESWEWEEGTTYGCDFFNPYLDFNEFALKLPGFTMPIMKYWDGQGLRPEHVKRSHTLRYVLKDLGTGKALFVVLFTLYLKEDVDEQGNLKEGVVGGKPVTLMSEDEKKRHHEGVQKAVAAGGKEIVDGKGEKEKEGKKESVVDTNEDDLD